MQTVAIFGTGLIGASFGLALKRAGFAGRIYGTSSPAAIEAALHAGAIDSYLPMEDAARLADLIYLAQPIGRILDTLHRLEPFVRPDALVTDAGSTKHVIVSAAHASLHRCQFLGGHPMAGKEQRGAGAADAELFRNRPYVLTPGGEHDLDSAPARQFVEWLHKIGAKPVIVGAEEHDRLVAYSSHVPQLASTALAATIAAYSPDSAKVAGPGLSDATRLAMSPYELWRDILATNTIAIEEALGHYIGELEHLRENLRTRQSQEEFARGAEFARKLRQ